MTVELNPEEAQAENNEPQNPNAYQKAQEMAETGKHAEALEFIQQHLNSNPDDTEALNDAGAIFHCMGRSQEAIDHLVKARSLNKDSAEIIWNLSETYLAIGDGEQAARLFDEMEEMGILNPEILNRAATAFLDAGCLDDALKMLSRSLEILPSQEEMLQPIMEIIRHKMDEAVSEEVKKP